MISALLQTHHSWNAPPDLQSCVSVCVSVCVCALWVCMSTRSTGECASTECFKHWQEWKINAIYLSGTVTCKIEAGSRRHKVYYSAWSSLIVQTRFDLKSFAHLERGRECSHMWFTHTVCEIMPHTSLCKLMRWDISSHKRCDHRHLISFRSAFLETTDQISQAIIGR